MIASPAELPRVVIRGVNELICESLANGGRAEPVAFFCECSDPGCYQPVWLTPAQFMLARNDPEWAALTDGHSAARLHET